LAGHFTVERREMRPELVRGLTPSRG
jgi:hypothetical protein